MDQRQRLGTPDTANASLDLGWLAAAETQARTAFLCAELAGNNALCAWVRGTQSLVAYWDERPRAAVELAADGWRYVPETGTARVRLAAIEARAHARLRDQRGTENALARAVQAREEVRGADDLGGMLTFPLAKQSFYTATARLWLSGWDSYTEAERDAAHAIELYEADPPEQRRLGELCLARLDLAAARLGRDDLDGAVDQLQDVLASAAQRRTEPVARRLLLTEAARMPRDILTNRDYLPSVAARAWRWAPEMHEVADTLNDQHLPTDLALATVLQRWADTATGQPTDPATILRQLHAHPS